MKKASLRRSERRPLYKLALRPFETALQQSAAAGHRFYLPCRALILLAAWGRGKLNGGNRDGRLWPIAHSSAVPSPVPLRAVDGIKVGKSGVAASTATPLAVRCRS
jgi:hypothetical protein